MTNDIIDQLVSDAKPIPRHALKKLFFRNIGVGTVAAILVMLFFLGLRGDLGVAMTTPVFITKIAYATLLLVLLIPALLVSARPVEFSFPWLRPLLVVVALSIVAAFQVIGASSEQQSHLVWGSTALMCPWLIVMVAQPIFVLLMFALKQMAPVSSVLSGMTAGLVAGCFAVLIYSFHCPEEGLPFVAIWYTAGILITGAIGAALGPLLLKW